MPFPLLLVPFFMGAAAGSVAGYLYLKDPLHLFSVENSSEEDSEAASSHDAAEDTPSGNSSSNNSMT